jgi:hypothetical protein
MDDRFQELYDRYCDGALTPPEQAEFLSLLDAPAGRARFVELAVLESAVTEELRLRTMGAAAETNDAMAACAAESLHAPTRRRPPASSDQPPRPWLWVALAAAGVLAALLPWFAKPGRTLRSSADPAPRGEPSDASREVAAVPSPRPAPDPTTPPATLRRDPSLPAAAEAGAPATAPPVASTGGEPPAGPHAEAGPSDGDLPPPKPWQRPNHGKKQPAAGRPAAPAPQSPRATETAVAVVTEAKGKVQVTGARGGPRQPARDDHPLFEGQGLHVAGPGGSAVLEFADGTLLELGPDTLVSRISAGDGAPGGAGHLGKSACLERGALGIETAPQPPDRPLILLTPHAEVRVLGTRLTLNILGNTTRLGVHEGEVQVTRLADEATLKVGAGHFAEVSEEGPLLASPLRTRAGLVALYPFDEGQGTLVRDVSGVGGPLPLRIANPDAVSWSPGGLSIHGPAGIVTYGPAEKIISACKASGELTLETWVKPAGAGRDGYVLAISSNPLNVNVALDQSGTPPAWGVHLTAGRTGEGGAALSVRRGPAAGALRHVVYAHAADGQGVLYIDGASVATHRLPGGFTRWDTNHRLALAADPRGNRPWTGELRLVAVFSRALTADEIRQHYLAGPD